jgi:hypothetical protein
MRCLELRVEEMVVNGELMRIFGSGGDNIK